MSVRLVSLNVQRSLNLERVVPFLRESSADVVCLQEVRESDIPVLRACGFPSSAFSPMFRVPEESPSFCGLAILARAPFSSKNREYADAGVYDIRLDDPTTWNNKHFSVLVGDIEKDGKTYRIATTHLRWTLDGDANDAQRADLQSLLLVLSGLGEFVLTGDFNAPRGREIFSSMAARYRDNVPAEYGYSLDQELHHIKGLRLMVDGMFSTPGYRVSDVSMRCGISDHCALAARVERVLISH